MAFMNIEYYSRALRRQTSFKLLIPNDPREGTEFDENAPLDTLFLLHGYTGNAGNWVPEYLCEKYRFAIVMPNGENSFYLNGLSAGHAFQTMVGEELVDYVRRTFRLANGREHTFIAGLSMGGFGALHTALAYPETFGRAVCLSSAFIQDNVRQMTPGFSDGFANFEYYRECFGEPAALETSENDPKNQVMRLKKEEKFFPGIFMACGTEDFLLRENREMHAFLSAEQVEHTYIEGPGIHDMVFWSKYIVKGIEWIYEEK